jgi:hypothetical protein
LALALGISRPAGILRMDPDDPLGSEAGGDGGDGRGENALSSENVVVDEAGDVLPPQPKKDPSFDVPGDLGSCLLRFEGDVGVVVSSGREGTFTGSVSFCNGRGLLENMDMVSERAFPELEVESSYQYPVDSEAAMGGEPMVNLACSLLVPMLYGTVRGTARLGLLTSWSRFTGSVEGVREEFAFGWLFKMGSVLHRTEGPTETSRAWGEGTYVRVCLLSTESSRTGDCDGKVASGFS